MNFLGPGTSYTWFLKMFHVKLKFFFPYEYFQDEFGKKKRVNFLRKTIDKHLFWSHMIFFFLKLKNE